MEQPGLKYIQTLSGGDTAFEKKLLNIIRDELPVEISLYQKQMEDQDYESAARSVHKLKHKISILDMTRSYELAVEYEESLKKGDSNEMKAFAEILSQMSRFINDFHI